MSPAAADDLDGLAAIVQRFDLQSLVPVLHACERLSRADAPLDVAVLGQFKSGKSSLLNALLGNDIFPVGVLPATAVVTRAQAAPALEVRVTDLEGSVASIGLERIGEFVTEAGNPRNAKRVAVVDVFTPALQEWPGIRLVDTPGLGSVLTHNTQTTRDWLPNLAVALVVVSAERPFSEEDRRLLDEARRQAQRVAIVLSKVDLLSDSERQQVVAFLGDVLQEADGAAIPILPFSTRLGLERWAHHFKETIIQPVVRDVAGERRRSLLHKRAHLANACRSYLAVGLQSAARADTDRAHLRTAVLDESVNAVVIHDELRLAEQRIAEETRPAFEQRFFARRAALTGRLAGILASEIRVWRGNLAQQTRRFESWMAEHLVAELRPLSQEAVPLAAELLGRAEARFRRIVEAFRDRLGRNIHTAMGITIAPAAWEPVRPQLAVIPVAVGRTFMMNWELLWWLLPMSVVGWLFRRHARGLVPWEVEKNLARLTSDWAAVVGAAISELRVRAGSWVAAERATLEQLLNRRPADATSFREALQYLERLPDLSNRAPTGTE